MAIAGEDRGAAGDRGVAVAPAEPERDRRARQRDPGEEHGVEQDHEGEQHTPRLLRAQAGLGHRPDRQRSAAGPRGGEHPGGGGAAERDLRAGPQVEPRGRALAHEPEEGDVADEREQFRHGRHRDPARIGGQRAAEGVREHLQPAAGEQQHAEGGRGERHRHGRAPRGEAKIEPGEDRLGSGDLMKRSHTSSIRAARAAVNGESP